MNAFGRFLFVTVGAYRLALARMIMPADVRERTWRFWMLDPPIADEVLEIGEIIGEYRDVEEKRMQAAPFN